MTDLAGVYEFGGGADGVLDGHRGVDAVLVEQVDVVDTESAQAALDGGGDVGRAGVDLPRAYRGATPKIQVMPKRSVSMP